MRRQSHVLIKQMEKIRKKEYYKDIGFEHYKEYYKEYYKDIGCD